MSFDSGFQLERDAAEQYQLTTSVFMRPLVHGLLEAAGIEPGHRVLDLACGPGIAAIEAAGMVGPTGRVDGVDINAAMIDLAQRNASLSAPVDWHVASAMSLPFDDRNFDRVIVQQGVQFFPDLVTSLAEMRRVTRPDGIVAATCWTPMETSPYMHAQYLALVDAGGEEAVGSFRSAFSLDSDDLTEAFQDAGLRGVICTAIAPEVELPPLSTYIGRHLQATPWAGVFLGLDDAGRKRFLDRVMTMLSPWTTGAVTTVPFSSWVVTGRV